MTSPVGAGHRSVAVSLRRAPRHAPDPFDDPDGWRAWLSGVDRPFVVDLFCGAGGLSLGATRAGGEVVLAVDTNRHALETHGAHFAGATVRLDLAQPSNVRRLVDVLDGVDVDVLVGGPPCQPFSVAGRSKIASLVAAGARGARDDRRALWRPFVDVALATRPRAVLLENVPEFALRDDSRIMRTIVADLESAGYEAECRLVDAWRHGVPQLRRRCIIVARRDGSVVWPVDVAGVPVTVGDALGDLPALGSGRGDVEMSYGSPVTPFQHAARRGVAGEARHKVFDHHGRSVRPDDAEAFALMSPETRYGDLPERLRRYRVDIFRDKYHRLDAGRVSRTVTAHIAKDGYGFIHPTEPRSLTVREAARLQTFPDWFRFAGTRSHAYAQIGNAVPPRLAEALIGALIGPAATEPTTTQRREFVRDTALTWATGGDHPEAAGCPWRALVGVVCGRSRAGRASAERILAAYRTVGDMPADPLGELITPPLSPFAARAALRCAGAAEAVRTHGWDCDAWVGAAALRPGEARWVRVVGLDTGELFAGAGLRRVARRLLGPPDVNLSSAAERIVLAQLLSADDRVGPLTCALSRLSETHCSPRRPACDACPLRSRCNHATHDAARHATLTEAVAA